MEAPEWKRFTSGLLLSGGALCIKIASFFGSLNIYTVSDLHLHRIRFEHCILVTESTGPVLFVDSVFYRARLTTTTQGSHIE